MDRQLVFKIQTSSSEGEVIFESPFPKSRNLSTKLTQKFGAKKIKNNATNTNSKAEQ